MKKEWERKITNRGGREDGVKGDHHALSTLKTVSLDLGEPLGHEVVKGLGADEELKEPQLRGLVNLRRGRLLNVLSKPTTLHCVLKCKEKKIQ